MNALKVTAALAFLAATFPLAAGSATTADVRARAVLASVRSATLARPLSSVRSYHSTGSVAAYGLTAKNDEWVDVARARYVERITGGPLAGAQGWDGTSAWEQDASGYAYVDDGTPARLQAIDQSYLDSFSYLAPDLRGGSARYVRRASAKGATYDIVRVTPPGGTPVELWVDAATHEIAKEIVSTGDSASTTVLSGYRRFGGVTIATRQSTSGSYGNSLATISNVTFDVPTAALVNVPQWKDGDASIAGGGSATVPVNVENDHTYVNVMLDGKGPFAFVFDTGGTLIVTPEVAKALHASTGGGAQIGGVGNAMETAGFTHLDSISLGGATIRNQYALVLPIATSFGMAEGKHIDGMIGYEAPARFLMTIDYAKSTMTLAMPGDPSAETAAASYVPFTFDRTIPRVAVTVDGVQTSAQVDTGSRNGITLSSPFVAAHPKIAALQSTAPGVVGFGIGGPAMGRLGRIPNLEIGPFSLRDTIGVFDTQKHGAFSSPYNPANVGGGIWTRFTMTLDYAHRRIGLTPNAAANAAYPFDRSGAFVVDNAGAYTIVGVRAGTPAATAGLAKGDVILSIDGATASSETLPGIRATLCASAGTLVRLRVKGAGGEREVVLKLADYV